MGISVERHKLHVAKWGAKFSNYKKKWPRYLFRHESVENALAVLKSGVLLSRQAASESGALQNDIAPEDIIQTRDDAYERVRLYFRPRTPTQYHIEGIRKSEYFYLDKHAGFLVMLVFDSQLVLTNESTRFSCGNMQSNNSIVYDGDSGFDNLDFSGIYHDEAYPSENQKRQRCAEVLAESPLQIAEALRAIVVRTDADANTIKYLLAKDGLSHLVPMVRKSEGTNVFFQNFTAVQYVDTAPGRINFQLKPTKYDEDIVTQLTLYDDQHNLCKKLVDNQLKPNTKYYVNFELSKGKYRLVIHLESCFAHESLVTLVPKV